MKTIKIAIKGAVICMPYQKIESYSLLPTGYLSDGNAAMRLTIMLDSGFKFEIGSQYTEALDKFIQDYECCEFEENQRLEGAKDES